jgi:hypothetical protein
LLVVAVSRRAFQLAQYVCDQRLDIAAQRFHLPRRAGAEGNASAGRKSRREFFLALMKAAITWVTRVFTRG